MAIKPEKHRKYYRKCSNNFVADYSIKILSKILRIGEKNTEGFRTNNSF